MVIKSVLVASVLGAVVALGSFAASAEDLSGKVTKAEGKNVSIGKKSFEISNSRTEVMVKGKKAKRGDIKVGMNCTASVEGEEAKKVDCK